MKKSTILIIIGFFIVITVFLGMSNKKMYQKEIHFETTNEILQQLQNKTLIAVNEEGIDEDTNDLKECFSERKRLTDLQFNYGKIEIEKIEELTEEEKASILSDYNNFRINFTKRKAISKEEPVRLDATVYYIYMEHGKLNYSKPQKKVIDLVFVDEGEGLVIDYVVEKDGNHIVNQEGNEDD